jgi:hypothetical protein
MPNAIEFEGVSKRYLLGVHHGSGSLRETLASRIGRLVRRERRGPPQEVWSL